MQGRVAGDLAAIAQGSGEIPIGGGFALATSGETLGVGAIAGAGISAHGYVMQGVAARDAASSLQELYKFSTSKDDTRNVPSRPSKMQKK